MPSARFAHPFPVGVLESPKQPEKRAQRLYRQLVAVTETTVTQVEAVLVRLKPKANRSAQALTASLQHYLPLVRQVIAQTHRRVFEGESVPAPEKLVSLFEVHTALTRRGKIPPRASEFGRKIW